MTGIEPPRAKVVAAVTLLSRQEPLLGTTVRSSADRGTDQ